MNTKIAKWGNSLGLRLPKELIEAVALEEGSTVQVKLVGKKIVISPESESLEDMVGRITPESRHDLLLESKPVGQELW